MQAAEVADQLVAGTQMQMVRVAEDHLRTDLAKVDGIERLHRRERSDGHERRRLDDTVRRRETARAASARLGVDEKIEWIHCPCEKRIARYTIAIASPYE